MSRQYLLAAVAVIPLAACEADATKQSVPNTTPITQQSWLCGREYVNHAWGYVRHGMVLDTAGNIWRYEVKRLPAGQAKPWDPKDVSVLTEEDLKMRYEGAVTTGTKVPADEIAHNMALIEEASNATPTPPKGVGADMGQTLLYCYTYDAAHRTYDQVMLDNRGDWDSTNPSQAAKTLTVWLNSRLAEPK